MNTEIARIDEAPVEVFQGWTPATLRAQIAREKEMRSIIVEYYQSCMVEGHHYYRIDKDERKKPSLTKEGALALCHLFKAHPHPEPPIELWTPDGHYGVRSSVSIIERGSGDVIAEGVGSCSTRESKYAYRMGSLVCPQCGKAAIIKGKDEYGGGWLCFRKKDGCGAKFVDGDQSIESQPTGRVPNEDIADQYNTVLKMSNKRATVDAALAMPLVSEIFTQDLEEQIDERAQGIIAEGKKPIGPPPEGGQQPSEKPAPPQETVSVYEVRALRKFMTEAYQDKSEVTKILQAAIGAPTTEEWSDYRISTKLTRAQHDELHAQAAGILKEEIQGSEPQDDDVPITPGPNASDSTETHEAPVGEYIGSPEESTSPIEETDTHEEVTTSDVVSQSPSEEYQDYATPAQLDALEADAAKIDDDAVQEVKTLRTRHRNISLRVYREVRDRLLMRLAQQTKAAKV